MLVTGSVGDVHPQLGIGRALQNRGHDVTVMTLACHRELVERAGLHAITVGTPEGTPTALANPKDAQQGVALKTLAAAFPHAVLHTARLLRDTVASSDSLILITNFVFSARVARDVLGVPLVTLHLQPAFFWSVKTPPVFRLPPHMHRFQAGPIRYGSSTLALPTFHRVSPVRRGGASGRAL